MKGAVCRNVAISPIPYARQQTFTRLKHILAAILLIRTRNSWKCVTTRDLYDLIGNPIQVFYELEDFAEGHVDPGDRYIVSRARIVAIITRTLASYQVRNTRGALS